MNITKSTKHIYWNLRRAILRTMIPEWVWPKAINLDGTTIEVRNMPFSFGVKYSLLRSTYEAAERELLKQIDLRGATVIEMGASLGVLTRIIAKQVECNGAVIAIEASESVAEITRQVTRRHANIIVLEGIGFPVFDVGDESLVRTFQEGQGTLGGRVIFRDAKVSRDRSKFEIYDLKSISKELNIAPNVLICDIEGAESVMLQYKPRIPGSITKMLIEFHPSLYGLETMSAIISAIESEGFKILDQKKTSFLFIRSTSGG